MKREALRGTSDMFGETTWSRSQEHRAWVFAEYANTVIKRPQF
jgi:hypothetical protein